MNLGHFRDFAIVPADGRSETTHPHHMGWRIIRSIEPEAIQPRLLMGRLTTTYRGYEISYDRKPGPGCDWDYVHKDYDGPEDRRCGSAATWDEALNEIDYLEDDD